ncbi:MAG: hypothetical protein JWM82_1377, partial [Myxococcales bacterium]|nr:hypothetical protein [Myxococcales bacterium]
MSSVATDDVPRVFTSLDSPAAAQGDARQNANPTMVVTSGKPSIYRPIVLSSRRAVPAPSAAMNGSPRSFHRSVLPALGLAVLAGGCGADTLFCDGAGCDLSDVEWSRLQSLAGPLPAPKDPSN